MNWLTKVEPGAKLRIRLFLEECGDKVEEHIFLVEGIDEEELESHDSYYDKENNCYGCSRALFLRHVESRRRYYLMVPVDRNDNKYITFHRLYTHSEGEFLCGNPLHFKEITRVAS